jgi:hypothetical protein
MAFKLPTRGIVFWPIGTGDSTTVCIDKETVLQIDLHHLQKSEDKEEPHWAIIDELERCLPKKNKRPFLAAFALTHPDQDHIKGFGELMERIDIGELWHTPYMFREVEKDHPLCEDAKVFRKEAQRRREAAIKAEGDPGEGNRVRVFGHSELYDEEKYKNFPKEFREYPGTSTDKINATAYPGIFNAFIHAPFKDVGETERNDTSLALQVQLKDGTTEFAALLLGDVSYPILRRIIDKTKANEGSDEKVLQQQIMDDLEAAKRNEDAEVVASCESDFSDEEGKNPPHLKARKEYEKIAGFYCTHEHPNIENPDAIVYEVTGKGLKRFEQTHASAIPSPVFAAVTAAKGTTSTPSQRVGHGRT